MMGLDKVKYHEIDIDIELTQVGFLERLGIGSVNSTARLKKEKNEAIKLIWMFGTFNNLYSFVVAKDLRILCPRM